MLTGGLLSAGEYPNPAPEWLIERGWREIGRLSALPSFAGLVEQFQVGGQAVAAAVIWVSGQAVAAAVIQVGGQAVAAAVIRVGGQAGAAAVSQGAWP